MATVLYLRTDTRSQMDAALSAAGIPSEGCAWCAVVHIGPIMGPFTGSPGAETCEVADGRHHANILLMRDLPHDAISSLPTIPEPSSPSVAWT